MMPTKSYPVLPLRNAVAFPEISSPFLVRRAGGVEALKSAQAGDGHILAVAQKTPDEDNPQANDLYRIGTLVKIERLTGSDRRGYQVLVRGVSRFHVFQYKHSGDHWLAEGQELPDAVDHDRETTRVLAKSVKELAHEILALVPADTTQVEQVLDQVEDPAYLSNICAANLDSALEGRQQLLETVSVRERLLKLLELMRERRDALSLQNEIRDKMAQKLNKTQRHSILREQLKAIQEELGESDAEAADTLKKRLEEAGLSEEAKKVADQELKRLEAIGPSSPESHVIRTYLEWLASMPWQRSAELKIEDVDLDRAQAILDEDHYGLEKIKDRILQHLAVMKLKKEQHGSILCFVGPPGVGKTSLGQSIAHALGRKFVRAGLGGMRDEAEIRGHRRTYIGAMPGRILQALKRAGENNPVFMLDEIDKLSHSYHGDPAAALLEVLDPEQNKNFGDHYLDVPFDLSKVFFVATCNSLETIPEPLLDRMEIIHLSGYTAAEKLHIAKRYLVPKQLKESGLVEGQVALPDAVLEHVIERYTREAGVRELQRKIGALFRAAVLAIARKPSAPGAAGSGAVGIAVKAGPFEVTEAWLEETLGQERYQPEVTGQPMPAGVVTGLAWTPHGGDILFIEASSMPGSGKLMLTGQLGDVMKESAQIALSLVRANLHELAPDYAFDKRDLHIHVPSGAIPKDGPSAGITMLTAIASLVSGRPVSTELAMTGEITLRGAVMPVGGIKEKVIAAHRAGVKRVILSRRNQRDLRDVPEDVKAALKFEIVDTARDVLKLALGIDVGAPAVSPDGGAPKSTPAVA